MWSIEYYAIVSCDFKTRKFHAKFIDLDIQVEGGSLIGAIKKAQKALNQELEKRVLANEANTFPHRTNPQDVSIEIGESIVEIEANLSL